MNNLCTAIITRYRSTDVNAISLRGLLGDDLVAGNERLWFMYAPHGCKLPICTFSMDVAGSTQGTMSSTGIAYKDVQTVTFHSYTDEYGALLCGQLLDAVKKLYDNNALSMSGGDVLNLVRRNAGAIVQDPDGGYGAHVDYEYLVSED